MCFHLSASEYYECIWGYHVQWATRTTHSPVLQLLAVDTHSSLVALGDAHLVPAAFNLLAWVLGGVYI